jgi:hypothetical protein
LIPKAQAQDKRIKIPKQPKHFSCASLILIFNFRGNDLLLKSEEEKVSLEENLWEMMEKGVWGLSHVFFLFAFYLLKGRRQQFFFVLVYLTKQQQKSFVTSLIKLSSFSCSLCTPEREHHMAASLKAAHKICLLGLPTSGFDVLLRLFYRAHVKFIYLRRCRLRQQWEKVSFVIVTFISFAEIKKIDVSLSIKNFFSLTHY